MDDPHSNIHVLWSFPRWSLSSLVWGWVFQVLSKYRKLAQTFMFCFMVWKFGDYLQFIEWTWNKSYNRHCQVCLITYFSSQIKQKEESLQQPIWQMCWLSNSKPPVHWQTHSSCLRVWRIHPAVHMFSRACVHYTDVSRPTESLTQTMLRQGYVAPRLNSSLQKFYTRHHNRVGRYGITVWFFLWSFGVSQNRLFTFSAWSFKSPEIFLWGSHH